MLHVEHLSLVPLSAVCESVAEMRSHVVCLLCPLSLSLSSVRSRCCRCQNSASFGKRRQQCFNIYSLLVLLQAQRRDKNKLPSNKQNLQSIKLELVLTHVTIETTMFRIK